MRLEKLPNFLKKLWAIVVFLVWKGRNCTFLYLAEHHFVGINHAKWNKGKYIPLFCLLTYFITLCYFEYETVSTAFSW